MENKRNTVKKLTSKDENAAIEIAKKMISEGDEELFKELIVQTDNLYPFVKENVKKRLEMAVNISNYKNLYCFMDYYSPDYDEIFINAFKYFGDKEVKEKMLEYLNNGTNAQKTYAARYFGSIKDIFAIKELIANAFSEDEYLADACASVLGELNEQKSFETALEKLKSNDDFESLSALNFFVSYEKNPPLEDIYKRLNTIGMPENFAGKIAYIKPLTVLLKEDIENALNVFDFILSGFGEILPLSEVFNYEMYDVISLISDISDSENASRIAVILLKAKSKFDLICNQEEYIFDEDKNTKNELFEIQNLLNSLNKAFWERMKTLVKDELFQDKIRIKSAFEVIIENKINSALPNVLETIYENSDETLLCEAFSVLKSLNALSYIDKTEALSMFKDNNIKALVESYYC